MPKKRPKIIVREILGKKPNILSGSLKKQQIESEKDEFLEDEEHEETPEEVETEMHTGKKSADTYTSEGREELLEEEGISEWEEGFAEGATGKGELAVCAKCEKPLEQDFSKVVEREVNHEILLFCSNKCANSYKKPKQA